MTQSVTFVHTARVDILTIFALDEGVLVLSGSRIGVETAVARYRDTHQAIE